MTFDYSELATTAQELLAEFGRDVTLRTVTPGAYDASTGTKASTSADTTRKAALFDFGDGDTEFQGTLIKQNDQRCLMDAIGTVPTVTDSIVIGGIVYTILSVNSLSPAGVPVSYSLHLRR